MSGTAFASAHGPGQSGAEQPDSWRSTLRMAYVVPTKDRPDDLRKLLASLAEQTVTPTQIVIVDGSDSDIEWVCKDFPALPLTYVREFPPSLARQRNAGMAALADDIDVAGYLDDDLELAADATERMLAFWKAAGPQVGGAAFTIVNQPARSRLGLWLSRLFLMNGPEQGKMLSSGFATSLMPGKPTQKTDWLYGGATLWRREVVSKYQYDEWYIGHGHLEDLDYSFRVSRAYDLYLVADTKVLHWQRPFTDKGNIVLGRQQMVNRLYFVRKMGCFSRAALVWAQFGILMSNLGRCLAKADRASLLRFYGNLVGLTRLLQSRGDPLDNGLWK